MKVTINHYHAVALWRWNLNPNASENVSNMMATDDDDEARKQAVGDDAALGRNAKAVQQAESEDGDADDDVCGICRIPFDGCCPECKVPGDACPLSTSLLTSRVNALAEGAELLTCSLGRMHACVPYALPAQVALDRVVQAAMPDGPQALG